MEKKKGLAWLNFMYSLFQMQILVKGALAIGTIVAVINSTRGEFGDPLFTLENAIAFFTSVLLLVDVAYKLLACVFNSKPIGYKFYVNALIWGQISEIFYIGSDQGVAVGAAFLVVAGIWFYINYRYVQKRKWVYGNPDLL